MNELQNLKEMILKAEKSVARRVKRLRNAESKLYHMKKIYQELVSKEILNGLSDCAERFGQASAELDKEIYAVEFEVELNDKHNFGQAQDVSTWTGYKK